MNNSNEISYYIRNSILLNICTATGRVRKGKRKKIPQAEIFMIGASDRRGGTHGSVRFGSA